MPDVRTTQNSVVAETQEGLLRGAVIDGVCTFKGVSYGEDTSARRFRQGLPVEKWEGVRDALEHGPQSPQMENPGGLFAAMFGDGPHSEDCLRLNVWTPSLGGKARPIMVWVHGGGYIWGSGNAPVYDGARLAAKGDVVVISITHRLGPIGFLHVGELLGTEYADSASVGMLDIVLALKWVAANARAFGGDPDNVTLFGESGGGAKINILMAMPAAQGLFHKAAIQSGSIFIANSIAEAATATQDLLNALGLNEREASQLLHLPTAKLVEAVTNGLPAAGNFSLLPVVDGHHLPRQPHFPDVPAGGHIPLLIGTTLTEASAGASMGDPDVLSIGWQDVADNVRATVPIYAAMLPPKLDNLDKAIERLREIQPDAPPSQIFFELATEGTFRQAAIRQAELRAAHRDAPTYVYLLTYPAPLLDGRLGSPHALDVPLVFDNVAKGESLIGEADANTQAVADQMSAAWIAFAWTNQPVVGDRPWPRYNLSDRATAVFDVQSRIVNDPRAEMRVAWS